MTTYTNKSKSTIETESTDIVLIDSYSESNQDSLYDLRTNNNIDKVGQCFTNENSLILDSCKFYLKKSGNPIGDMVAKFYEITGTYGTNGKPTGSALATSAPISASTLTTSFQLITFLFTGLNRINLNSSTYYVIVLEPVDLGDTNFIQIGIDQTTPSHSGNTALHNPFPAWNVTNSTDVIFYIYGVAIIQSSTVYSNPTKNPATFTNKTKNTTSWTNKVKN